MKKVLSVFLAVLVAMLPLSVCAAENTTLSVSVDQCEMIGDCDGDAIFLYETALESSMTTVVFPDFSALMGECGIIGAINSNAYVEFQNEAPLSAAYQVSAPHKDWTLYDGYTDYDFSGCYVYWLMDDDADQYFFVISNTASDNQGSTPSGVVPQMQVDGADITGYTVEKGAYSYTDYLGATQTADLYTFVVPDGTTSADLSFDRNVLAYNYASRSSTDNDYLSGMIEDFMTGSAKYTVQLDVNDDKTFDYIQIQSPYDASWNSDLLCAVTFRYASQKCTVTAGGKNVQTYTLLQNGYTYTDWTGTATTVDLYVYPLPANTQNVSLAFEENVLVYNYGSRNSTDDDFLSGMIDDYMTGSKTYTLPVDSNRDSAADCLQVQTPYDAAWNSQVLFAVTFDVTLDPPADPGVLAGSGITGAKNYLTALSTENDYVFQQEWIVFSLLRAGGSLTDAQKANYLRSVEETYRNPAEKNLKPTTLARVILTLGALGEDATDFRGISLMDLLLQQPSAGAASNEAAWTLLALNACSYTVPENSLWTRESLVRALLSFQNDNGGFGLQSTADPDADKTAMALQALAPYRAGQEAAVAKALEYLRTAGGNNGTYDNAETYAQVLIALTALGVDPMQVSNGFADGTTNLVSALAAFQNETTGGFFHQAGQSESLLPTVQALMALEAYRRSTHNENALFDLHDVEPNAKPEQPDSSNPSTGDEARIVLYSVLMIVTLSGLVLWIVLRRKANQMRDRDDRRK